MAAAQKLKPPELKGTIAKNKLWCNLINEFRQDSLTICRTLGITYERGGFIRTQGAMSSKKVMEYLWGIDTEKRYIFIRPLEKFRADTFLRSYSEFAGSVNSKKVEFNDSNALPESNIAGISSIISEMERIDGRNSEFYNIEANEFLPWIKTYLGKIPKKLKHAFLSVEDLRKDGGIKAPLFGKIFSLGRVYYIGLRLPFGYIVTTLLSSGE